MKKEDYNSTIQASISAEEAYKEICHVSDWWTSNVGGPSAAKGDIFTVTFGETFVNFIVSEAVPYSKIVWKVLDCNLHWLKDKKEWKNTEIVFDVLGQGKSVTVSMAHIGLVPEIECFENCKKGWDFYVKESLAKLLSTGKGLPETPKVLR